MAGENKTEDPFENFVDHTAEDADSGSTPVTADSDDTAEGDDADDKGEEGSSQKEMDLGDDNDGDDEEGDDATDADDDPEDGGEDADEDDPEDGGSEDDEVDPEEDDEEDDPKPQPKKNRPVKERIAEFRKRTGTAERRASTAERRAAAAEARVEELEAGLTQGDKGGNAETDDNFGLTAPDPEKYKYGEMDQKFQTDLTKYTVDLALAERDAKNAATQQEAAAQETAEGLAETYDTRVVDGIKAYDDFEEVVMDAADNGKFPLSETVGMLALESDVGHHVLYKIAGDLALAKKLDAMTPAQQGREFGRLEAQFSKRAPRKKNNKTNTTPPASRRRGGKSGSGRVKGNTKDFRKFEEQARSDERAREKR